MWIKEESNPFVLLLEVIERIYILLTIPVVIIGKIHLYL